MSGTTSSLAQFQVTAGNLFAALCGLAEAVRAAATDPGVQIRLLEELANQFPAEDPTQTAAMCRRAALISLSLASSNYQPSSYQDAIEKRATIVGLLDAEAIVMADEGSAQSYLAFKALAAQVAADLTTKAGTIATVTEVTLPKAFPVLYVAFRLYGDATRADDLMARSGVVEPNFMPTSFEALSS
jgi:prophage DNA circulation protein